MKISNIPCKTDYIPAMMWDEPDVSSIPADKRAKYKARKEAVDMVIFGNVSIAKAAIACGLTRQHLNKLLNKCFSLDGNGAMLGYLALVPYRHKKERAVRSCTIEGLMSQYPDIQNKIIKFYFKKGGNQKAPDKIAAFRKFQELLLDKGFTNYDYPRTLEDRGMRSFYRWLNKVELSQEVLALARADKDAKQKHKSTGGLIKAKRDSSRPYSLIQIDAHDCDFNYCIETFDKKGNPVLQDAGRPVLFAAIDVATSCIVAYQMCYGFKPNHGTVLKLIERIIKPQGDLEDDPEKAAVPSELFPEARWAMPEVIKLDNASIQLAQPVMDCIERYGIVLQFGPVATPTYRSKLERFFGTFETTAGHLLPSTTGSSPKDLKRGNPGLEAVQFGITREVIDEYVRLAITQYNNMATAGQDGASPYQRMGMAINQGLIPNHLTPKLQNDNFKITKIIKRTIRAYPRSGKRPHIIWNGTEYSGENICSDYSLNGKEVMCEVDTDDTSYMIARYSDGTFLDILYAKGNHQHIKLSEQAIKEINKNRTRGYIENNSGMTVTDKFVEDLGKNRNKKLKILAAEIQAETKGDLPHEVRADVLPEPSQKEKILEFNNEMKRFNDEREGRKKADIECPGSDEESIKNMFRIAFGDNYFDEQ